MTRFNEIYQADFGHIPPRVDRDEIPDRQERVRLMELRDQAITAARAKRLAALVKFVNEGHLSQADKDHALLTAVMDCCGSADQYAYGLLNHMLESGANINSSVSDNDTPLMVAINKNNISVVNYLLSKKGADANFAMTETGETPLMRSLEYMDGGNGRMVFKLLLEYNADPLMAMDDGYGDSALMLAAMLPDEDAAYALGSMLPRCSPEELLDARAQLQSMPSQPASALALVEGFINYHNSMKASTSIQAVVRGNKVRSELKQQQYAATAIQSFFRTRKARSTQIDVKAKAKAESEVNSSHTP
jgi:ankyrin repeat protein